MNDDTEAPRVRYVGTRAVIEDENRVRTTAPTPERAYLLDCCISALHRTPTVGLIEYLPVLERHAQPITDGERANRMGLRVLSEPSPDPAPSAHPSPARGGRNRSRSRR